MKSVGIVAEYNPFHNGHLYHLNQSKEVTGSDIAIVAMSGNFLQRGEPAIVSKWSRTKMALQAGADIVVEIPYAFAVQKAEIFARGSISLLHALKCQSVCFGSESGSVEPFYNTLDLLEEKKEIFNMQIRKFIKKGVSYPKALSLAYSSLDKGENTVDLSKPNNILGYHYISAAKQMNSPIKFYTIRRNQAEHNDQTIHHEKIASATSIRNTLFEHSRLEDIKAYIPESSYKEMEIYHQTYGHFHHWEDYLPYLQYRLLTMSDQELELMYDTEKGLPNRLQKTASHADSFQSFMESVKTKRYTWTRLQRINVHALTNTAKPLMKSAGEQPSYIRLLGMSAKGRTYLNQIKKEISLPLISTPSMHPPELLALDQKAALVYAQALSEPQRNQLYSMEFSQPPIMADSIYS